VCDANTGKEIDWQDVDSTFFVLTVDLWDQEGSREVNLVRHSSGAPTVSISSSTTTSYPPTPDRHPMYMVPQLDQFGRQIQVPYSPAGMPPGYYQGSGAPAPSYTGAYAVPNPYAPAGSQHMVAGMNSSATTTGMFTRNLIGSLTVNAFRLEDTTRKVGFWFVLQDLSVRTEGLFR
jgi:hypothetical protein